MKFSIPDDVKTGTGDELFGFLADSVARFCALECGGNPHGSLGFTFSFPVEQTELNAGKLLVWILGFGASGCLGEDVVALLQQQFESRGIELRVEALANDTVGTMEAAAYRRRHGDGRDPRHRHQRLRREDGQRDQVEGAPSDEMVINTEWGNLQMDAFMNGYDRAVDAATVNPGKQTFKEAISGVYPMARSAASRCSTPRSPATSRRRGRLKRPSAPRARRVRDARHRRGRHSPASPRPRSCSRPWRAHDAARPRSCARRACASRRARRGSRRRPSARCSTTPR